jgi:hypothetical protein
MKFIYTLLLAISLTSCSWIKSLDLEALKTYTISTVTLISAVHGLPEQLTATRSSVLQNRDKFSSEDWDKLVVVDNNITDMQSTMTYWLRDGKSVESIVTNLHELHKLVEKATVTYSIAKSVYLANHQSLTPTQVNQILELDGSIMEVYTQYNTAMASAESNVKVNNLITLISQSMKLILKVAGMVMVV